jgi:sugar O-acyltransferase (sialic acid O-acetyltransferase NeuD family)
MSKPKLIIIGAGGHARSCINLIEELNNFEIAGLIDDFDHDKVNDRSFVYPFVGRDSDLFSLADKYKYVFIAIGQIKSASRRMQLYNQANKLGFVLPIIKASTAYVSANAKVGDGTVIMHGAIINAGAVVGKNCIINSRALIEHDSIVGDHCHISTGAVLNGGVNIGRGSFIGSGCIVKNGLYIGKDCLIGMGVNVKNDLQDGEVLKDTNFL